jgi:hypothetical protein
VTDDALQWDVHEVKVIDVPCCLCWGARAVEKVGGIRNGARVDGVGYCRRSMSQALSESWRKEEKDPNSF